MGVIRAVRMYQAETYASGLGFYLGAQTQDFFRSQLFERGSGPNGDQRRCGVDNSRRRHCPKRRSG